MVGMGRELVEAFTTARLVYEEVDEALRQRLSRIIFEGAESDLTLTENAQPALMATSMAVFRVLAEGGLEFGRHVAFVAGHSLGEYSALAAAGTLSLADAARLLKLRGQAMQRAVPVGEGAMAALLGLDLETATAVAEEARGRGGEVCDVANDNAPGQVVVSGHAAAVDRAVAIAKERGARRAMQLSVSAPFHCALMQPAAEAMEEALAETAMAPPAAPLVANVTADPVTDVDTIRALLVEQVTQMVRWRESVLRMQEEGVDGFAEVGPGRVLSGLAKRIAPDVPCEAVLTPEDVERILKSL